MEQTVVFEVSELSQPMYSWQQKPEAKPKDRNRVLPKFSMIDPKGENDAPDCC